MGSRQTENRETKNSKQDLQDGLSIHQPPPSGKAFVFEVWPIFHPVNPVHPVGFQRFDCIVPRKQSR
jgi:hypothetical protein